MRVRSSRPVRVFMRFAWTVRVGMVVFVLVVPLMLMIVPVLMPMQVAVVMGMNMHGTVGMLVGVHVLGRPHGGGRVGMVVSVLVTVIVPVVVRVAMNHAVGMLVHVGVKLSALERSLASAILAHGVVSFV